jgi:hypothetical protein
MGHCCGHKNLGNGRVFGCNENSSAQSGTLLNRSLCVKHTDAEIHKILHKKNSSPYAPISAVCLHWIDYLKLFTKLNKLDEF